MRLNRRKLRICVCHQLKSTTCAMEACLGLGRNQRNLNKQQQKDLKLQDQQQEQYTRLKQQTQVIITNQNYYTTQQQLQNQRYLVARGQPTSLHKATDCTDDVGIGVQQQPQPQTISFQKNTVTAAATTTANMQQPSLHKATDCTDDVGIGVQQQPQPQTISFQKNTVTVEVTPTIPSTVRPANTPGIVTNASVKTFRKINRQAQQRQEQKRHQFQQQHQHHHLLQQQQQQQLEADLDVIEMCVDPEPHVSFKSGGGLLRITKTLGRLNHQHQHYDSIRDQHGQWTNMPQITSLQLLQLQQQQQQQQHDYSYAYYEPGAVMKHANIPHAELMAAANEEDDLTPPPPNSIRALLLKGKKNKLLVSQTTSQSNQTRLTQQQSHSMAASTVSANCSNVSTPENFYEEISASSTSSSSNSMTSPHQLRATSHSSRSLTRNLIKEELRRVQSRHHKILDELNLSVEAMLMPESLPNSIPAAKEPPTPSVSVTTASGQPLRLTSSSADNICDAALAGGPADDFISPIPNSATVSAGLLQSSCLAADLDSGFSGSSGASYIGTLRLPKTKALMSSRSNNLSSTRTATAGGNAAAKSQQSAFACATQSCRSCQRADSHNVNANATTTSAHTSSSSAAIATTSRSIKHLLQIHQNTKQQQQQLHHHHLHQQQQHQQSQHINDGLHNSSRFFTLASCGCRILNCAKIRAAEDPGPVVLNAQPNISKARSFWNRKGWLKLPGFSTPTSSIHDAG